MIQRGYKAVMSKGDDIKLDPEEVAMVESAAEQGMMVRVKQGLINPSFLVTIIEDKEREMRYGSGPRSDAPRLGITPLRDVFKPPAPMLEGGKN